MDERDELERARRLIARMAAENQLVRAENTRLRRLAANRGRGRTLSYALADARAMLAWRWAGLAISRRACEGYGMPVRRWEWARALLLAARVLDIHTNDVASGYDDDIAHAVAAVERTAERMAATGDISGLLMRRRRYAASGAASGVASGVAAD